jgi:hypothetical protein
VRARRIDAAGASQDCAHASQWTRRRAAAQAHRYTAMARLPVTIALVALMGTLDGCNAGIPNHRDSEAGAPRHTSAEAIQIALRQRPDLLHDLSEYDPLVATYESSSGSWWISFHYKATPIDGCFYLQLDDRTAKLSKRVIACG